MGPEKKRRGGKLLSSHSARQQEKWLPYPPKAKGAAGHRDKRKKTEKDFGTMEPKEKVLASERRGRATLRNATEVSRR